jgi:hypothetical protein
MTSVNPCGGVRFKAHSGGKSNIARGPKSAREETSYQLFGPDLTAFERSHSGAARNRSPIGVARRAAGTSRSSGL